jgi:hypothetical protein
MGVADMAQPVSMVALTSKLPELASAWAKAEHSSKSAGLAWRNWDMKHVLIGDPLKLKQTLKA